jgi:hypothetical protein
MVIGSNKEFTIVSKAVRIILFFLISGYGAGGVPGQQLP